MKKIWRHFFLLCSAMLLLSGCSSQDFGRPVSSSISDVIDSGEAYVNRDDEKMAARRSEQLAQALAQWETQRNAPQSDYRIGPDDVLEVSIMSLEEPGEYAVLSVAVTREGTVDLPLIGAQPVADLTASEIEDLVIDAYKRGYLKNPRVTVKMSEYRSSPVVITGAVSEPGIYYLRHNSSTVLDVLSLSRGLAPQAGDKLLIVRRMDGQEEDGTSREVDADSSADEPEFSPTLQATNSGPDLADTEPEETPASPVEPAEDMTAEISVVTQALDVAEAPAEDESEASVEPADTGLPPEMIEVDLRRLLDEGDMRLNATIQGGDIVTVPPAITEFVYVLGYVNAPGAFELKKGQSLRALQAVAMAKGLSTAARAENSFLITEKEGRRKVIEVNLTKIARGVRPPVYMRPGDTLVVGSSLLARLGEFVKPSLSAGASVTPGAP